MKTDYKLNAYLNKLASPEATTRLPENALEATLQRLNGGVLPKEQKLNRIPGFPPKMGI